MDPTFQKKNEKLSCHLPKTSEAFPLTKEELGFLVNFFSVHNNSCHFFYSME